MNSENVFEGSLTEKECVDAIYGLLITGKRTTISMVLAKCMKRELDFYENVKLSALNNVENNYYLKIRQKLGKVISAIECKCPGSIETNGGTKGKWYRYVGNLKDPLCDMRNAATIKDIQRYWEFCQNTAGVLPTVWLEYFLRNTIDFVRIKERMHKGDVVIRSSVNRELRNIGLLPRLYETIIAKRVVRIKYEPYGCNSKEHIFHPQFLNEFDGRWQVLGYEANSNHYPVIYSLDRICGEIEELDGERYEEAEHGFFQRYFATKVGASQMSDEVSRVVLRAHGMKMFNYTLTKPICENQRILNEFAEHEDGGYGDFEMDVEVNNEFFARVMGKGSGLEVLSPESVRKEIGKRFAEAADLYQV